MNDIPNTSTETNHEVLLAQSGSGHSEGAQPTVDAPVSEGEKPALSPAARFSEMSLEERLFALCDKVESNGISLGGAELRSILDDALAGQLPDIKPSSPCDWKSSHKPSDSDNEGFVKYLIENTVSAIYALEAVDRFKGDFHDQICLMDIKFPKWDREITSLITNISRDSKDCDVISVFTSKIGLKDLSIKWAHVAACCGNRVSMIRLAERLGEEAVLEKFLGNHEESHRLALVSGAWWRLSMASIPKTSYSDTWDVSHWMSYKSVNLLDLEKYASENEVQLPLARYLSFCPGAIEIDRSSHTVASEATSEGSGANETAKPAPHSEVVVLASITESSERDIKEVLKRFRRLTEPMPFSGGADPDVVHATLAARFPWMTEANRRAAQVASVAKASKTPNQLRLNSPLVLVGPSGAGKSLWSRCLAKALGLHLSTLSFAGLSSSKLLTGTERGWGSTHPSFPAVAMRQHMVANPMLLVDEADKTASSDYNGDLLQVLSTMTEPSTSKYYLDTCLLGELDLSWISWVLTVNSLAPLPQPLLDRSTIIHVAAPGEEHYDPLFEMVRDAYIEDNNLRAEAVPDVSDQKDAIRRKFIETRSVRALKMAYEEAVLSRMWQEPGYVEPPPPATHLRLV